MSNISIPTSSFLDGGISQDKPHLAASVPTSTLPVNTIPSFPSQSTAYVPQPIMTTQGYPYGQVTGGGIGWNAMSQQQQMQQQQLQMHQQYPPLQPQQFPLHQQQQPYQQQPPHQQPQVLPLMQQPSFIPVSSPSPSVLTSTPVPASATEDDFEFSEFTSATAAPSVSSSVSPVAASTGVMIRSTGEATLSNHFGDLMGGMDSNSVSTGMGMDDEMGDFMTADLSAQLNHTSNQSKGNNNALASVSVDDTGTPRNKPSASVLMENMLASLSTNILAPVSPPPSLKSLLTPSGGDQLSSSPVVTPTKPQQRSSPRNDRMVCTR